MKYTFRRGSITHQHCSKCSIFEQVLHIVDEKDLKVTFYFDRCAICHSKTFDFMQKLYYY